MAKDNRRGIITFVSGCVKNTQTHFKAQFTNLPKWCFYLTIYSGYTHIQKQMDQRNHFSLTCKRPANLTTPHPRRLVSGSTRLIWYTSTARNLWAWMPSLLTTMQAMRSLLSEKDNRVKCVAKLAKINENFSLFSVFWRLKQRCLDLFGHNIIWNYSYHHMSIIFKCWKNITCLKFTVNQWNFQFWVDTTTLSLSPKTSWERHTHYDSCNGTPELLINK